MKKSMMFRAALSLLLLGTVAGVIAAERPHFDSQRRDGAIAVDGKYDDWYGHLQPFGTDPVSIQFLNDGEFLYVRLTASDAGARMQIMRMGLTLWFDSAGGTKKRYGIRYPVVERGEDRGGRDGGGGAGGGRGRGGGGMGGRGGGGGGRGGGGQRGGVEPPKPLKGWATVTIAPVG